MKKSVFALGIVLLLVAGCEEYYKNKQVINNSDYEVTFTFNHFRERVHILKPHTSDYYSENNITIKSYSANPPRVSYITDYDNEIVTFFNTPARSIKIINELDKDILVTSQGCMDNEPVVIYAESELIIDIYTLTPKFSGVTAIDKFPVEFIYSTNNSSAMVHW
jgi:hypothetical protein